MGSGCLQLGLPLASGSGMSLALGLGIPLIEVNHMEAHILAHFISDEDTKRPPFPFLGMTISGGHTQIVRVNSYFEMEVLGETLDDAVGEGLFLILYFGFGDVLEMIGTRLCL